MLKILHFLSSGDFKRINMGVLKRNRQNLTSACLQIHSTKQSKGQSPYQVNTEICMVIITWQLDRHEIRSRNIRQNCDTYRGTVGTQKIVSYTRLFGCLNIEKRCQAVLESSYYVISYYLVRRNEYETHVHVFWTGVGEGPSCRLITSLARKKEETQNAGTPETWHFGGGCFLELWGQ